MVKFSAISEMQRVFRILRIIPKLTIRKVVRTLILHIPNSKKIISCDKNCLTKKLVA